MNVKEPITKTLKRNLYVMTPQAHTAGSIGSLQCIHRFLVMGGDSVKLNMAGVFRLSPLRRNMYMDARVDLFAFYVKHRYTMGQDWVTFLKSGTDEAVSFGTDTLAAGVSLSCVGPTTAVAATLPRWLTRGPIFIWNRYFRDPSDTSGVLAENYFTGLTASDEAIVSGLPCANLPEMHNSTIVATTTTGDYRLALDGGEVDLLNLSALQGRLKSELQRDWFDFRYQDLMHDLFGAQGVSADADTGDYRPDLIMHSVQWLSGQDVNGTDDATLGRFSGKGLSICKLSFPERYFPEHGVVWIMALIRFPYVSSKLTDYLSLKSQPTYLEISGDPDLVSRQAPITLNANEVFIGAGSVDLGKIPYAQWLRTIPSYSHPLYEFAAGHPFITSAPTSRADAVYIGANDYDNVFETLQMRHWQANCAFEIQKRSYLPDPLTSIFAGTNSH